MGIILKNNGEAVLEEPKTTAQPVQTQQQTQAKKGDDPFFHKHTSLCVLVIGKRILPKVPGPSKDGTVHTYHECPWLL